MSPTSFFVAHQLQPADLLVGVAEAAAAKCRSRSLFQAASHTFADVLEVADTRDLTPKESGLPAHVSHFCDEVEEFRHDYEKHGINHMNTAAELVDVIYYLGVILADLTPEQQEYLWSVAALKYSPPGQGYDICDVSCFVSTKPEEVD